MYNRKIGLLFFDMANQTFGSIGGIIVDWKDPCKKTKGRNQYIGSEDEQKVQIQMVLSARSSNFVPKYLYQPVY